MKFNLIFKSLSIALLIVAVGRSALAMENQANYNLILGIQSRNMAMVREALNQGADINYKYKDINYKYKYESFEGFTPLHWASHVGYQEIAQLLLENGADITSIASAAYEATPLHIASKRGHLEIVKLFLNNGAQIDCTNKWGQTPLHIAYNKKIVKLLLERGADINCKDNGWTLLHKAAHAAQHNEENIKFLLNYDADLDPTNHRGETALDIAKNWGNNEAIELLTKEPEKRKLRQEYQAAIVARLLASDRKKHDLAAANLLALQRN